MSVLRNRVSSFSLSCLLAAMPLLAQDPVPGGQATGEKIGRPVPVLVTMSFPGGTMAEFVARIRAAEPRANIVVAADAAAAPLPPLELRGAGLEQALDAASIVAAAEFVVRVHEFKGTGEPVYSIVAIAASNSPTGNPGIGTKVEDGTQVFSLNRLTADATGANGAAKIGFPESTILSAVEAGTQDGAKAPVMRFHKDSGLLIVRGTRAQLSIAKDILSNLERDVEARRRQITPRSMGSEPSTVEAPAATEPSKK